MPFIVLSAGPAGGKGTQARIFAQKCPESVIHLETSQILKSTMKSGHKDAALIHKCMNVEHINVPDEIVCPIMREQILSLADPSKLIILDGFPRNGHKQLECLEGCLKELGMLSDLYSVFFDSNDETLDNLMRGRQRGREAEDPEVRRKRRQVWFTDREPLWLGLTRLSRDYDVVLVDFNPMLHDTGKQIGTVYEKLLEFFTNWKIIPSEALLPQRLSA